MIDTVKQFDKHHTLYKNHHYKSSADICSNLVISFKEKLPNAYKATKAKFEVWEIVQWPSGNFKGHLDIENIWVFIAFPVSMVSIESKKRNLPFASLGENFLRGF